MKVIGLISGTSTDGVDSALVDISGRGLESRLQLLRFATFPYPLALRSRLVHLTHDGRVEELSRLNVYVGELFAGAAVRIAREAGIPLDEIDLIGSHGQTICHQPVPMKIGGMKIRSTLQIGEPSVIAERTGVTTVSDFRHRDMAAGGEGAPLTPYLHYILFYHPQRPRLVVNIGGISNLTYLPSGTGLSKIVAFDAGPGNMLMDGIVQHRTNGRRTMDRDGAMARRGKVHEELLNELLRHPFLNRKPPKTTGREAFGQGMIRRLIRRAGILRLNHWDLMATVTAFTARSIAQAYRGFILPGGNAEEVIVGGGGTRNVTLMRFLQQAFGPVPVLTFEKFDLDSRALEAMAFALFAYGTIQGEPNNVPSATGAKRPVVMGKIVPGRNGLIIP
ncbi:MAG TPA: anhydro-N-acetylmuramic acid kinase [Nitrospiria bacterium]|jgi:anhydro-N-acetylmuramic acid kinase|nr:anhydro-N-acetylmuramic acid kinase [Nitrospiria bacterium]